MQLRNSIRASLAFTVASLLAGTAHATNLTAGKGSSLTLDGDSTLHRYKIDAKALKIDATIDATIDAVIKQGVPVAEAASKGGINSLVVTIPVARLSSGESGMDHNMVVALKGAEHPDIVFHMDSYAVGTVSPSGGFSAKLSGRLAIAGVEKSVTLDVQATPTESGLHVVGSKELRMSDFGVQPPVLMAGMLKVADKITIRFDLAIQAMP